MRFTFMKNNKRTKKCVNCVLQDGAGTGMLSLQTSIVIKLPNTMEWTLAMTKFGTVELFILILDIPPLYTSRLVARL